MSVVEVRELRKAYGPIVAVDDISFSVAENEVFGLVGPNGAGKTTTIECLEGLRDRDGGAVSVLGLDPGDAGADLRRRIGVQLQESSLFDRIRVQEALDLFASFYPQSIDWRPLIAQLGLGERLKAPFVKLSGGQKQRLFIALALVNDPELVFLDELSTGLDPQARRTMWGLVRSLRDKGKTVFLSTHFMEEAERLCDRVAIMDQGKIVALDTPENLIGSLGVETRVVFTAEDTIDAKQLESLANVTRVEASGDRVIVHGQGDRLVSEVVRSVEDHGWRFRDLRSEQPTLDDVFLALTGRALRE
ncbi:MAG: ABC transporter ATP-binding protein [Chloroflexota bacterium]|nr:ABC transporter ATP-binding protein [Chloroflexota bacterium]